MRRPKTITDKAIGLRVYNGNELHFNDYLRQQVGAGWYVIRNDLYDAGYTTWEVFEYREKLLEDFRELCRQHRYIPIVYR